MLRAGVAERLIEIVEVSFAFLKLILKEVGNGDYTRAGVFRERCGDGSAAVAAAEQRVADGGVGFVAEGGFWFQEHEA